MSDERNERKQYHTYWEGDIEYERRNSHAGSSRGEMNVVSVGLAEGLTSEGVCFNSETHQAQHYEIRVSTSLAPRL
jgi:hypothetical protein